MVQNTLARVVTLTKKRDHIQPTLKRLHWLPIRQRVNYEVAMLTYTIRLFGLIDYRPTRTLRSADEHLLVEPRTKLYSADRAFSAAAPKLWNTIPADIRNSNTITIFRKLLKTYLYKQAFEHNCQPHYPRLRLDKYPFRCFIYILARYKCCSLTYLLTQLCYYHTEFNQIVFKMNKKAKIVCKTPFQLPSWSLV